MGVGMNTKNRIEYLDVARGLTIIMIVIYHVLGETNLFYHHFVTTMCIELFVFVAGYFYRGFDVKKNVVKLVLPYALLIIGVRVYWNFRLDTWDSNTISDILKQILLGNTYDYLWSGHGYFVGIAWFFPMLVVARILYSLICRIENENYLAKGFVALIISCAGVVIGSHGYYLPWSIDIAMAAIFFMFLGDFTCKYRDIAEALYKKIWYVPLMLIAWTVIVKCYGYGEFPFRSYPNGITFFVSSTLALFIVIMICFFINNHFKILTKILKTYGKYSFVVLVGHVIDKSCITHSPDTNIYLLAVWELFLASIPMFVLLIFKGIKGRLQNGTSK